MKKVANFIDLVQQRQGCSGQRRLVVLSGSRDWTENCIAALNCDLTGWLLVAADDHGLVLPGALRQVSGKQAHQVLGQEYPGILFDCAGGFNPNGFGQVCGTLKAGGLLILLAPPFARWPEAADPERSSLVTGSGAVAEVGHRFIDHLLRTIREDPHCLVVAQDQPLPPLPERVSGTALAESPSAPYLSRDQQRVVEHCLQRFRDSDAGVTVITADRGRGKSTALGLIAARLMSDADLRIVVTAPGRGAIAPLLARLQHLQEELHDNRFICGRSSLRFLLPDQLLQERPVADLLLVDEAAAIPAPVLRQLLEYPRVIYASTIHGYEGTGQGFAVRFLNRLSELRPDWQHLKMQQPIRWAAGDPLEAFCYRALMLDAEPAPVAVTDLTSVALSFQRLDRDLLVQQPDLLKQLFGLLILAHYRTTPGDLRILLDSPNLQVWAALTRINGRQVVVATALLAEEGPIDSELAAEIQAGRRRPKGQLIPQTLLAHGQLTDAGCYRGLRVMRIAVQPELQRRGLATRLLNAIEQQAVATGYDWLGTSFGLTTGLMRFWRESGMKPVRLGHRKDKVSATYAAVLLKGLTPGACQLQQQAVRLCLNDASQRDDLSTALLDALISAAE